jgi:mono/diheme cytochrome c family protein/glucose/arabinose dehydrogenase
MLFLTAFASAQAGDAKDKPGTRQEPPSGFAIPAAPALSPADALAAFVVEAGYDIELVAAEPEVVAPVAMVFDAHARLWVVEMRGYMPDADGAGEDARNGAIAVLQDRDGDGRFETRTTFLDGLVLPRAVCVLRDAALVLAPPRLLLCPDRDGDLRADRVIEVADGLEGFVNPEHAPNGLLWALDNRIYLSKHGVCYRWDGATLHKEASPSLGQWGLSQDDYGRLYSNDNSTHLRVDLLPRQLASANVHAGRPPGLEFVACRDQQVWPLRVTPGVNRGYQSGVLRDGKLTHFTAACSPLVYRGALLAQVKGHAFVCEPAANLVRCAKLSDDGASVRATPFATGREFLTSHDERFRPVALAEGPEGALYVADMARGVIQHRLFVTTFLRRQIEERGLAAPLDRGRIWRVVPSDVDVPGRVRVGEFSARELVAALAHESGFVRDQAQRALVLRGRHDVVPDLEAHVARSADVPALHALWTLHGLGALRRALVLDGMFAPSSVLRAASYEIAGANLSRRRDVLLASVLLRRAREETNARGLRILALVLGQVSLPEMPAAVFALAARSTDDLVPPALLAGLGGREVSILREAAAAGAPLATGARALAVLCAAAIARREAASELIAVLDLLHATTDRAEFTDVVLTGLLTGAPRAGAGVRAAGLGSDASVRAAAARPLIVAPALQAKWEQLSPAFAPRGPEPAAPLTPEQQAQFEHGRTLYLVCAGCHGTNGEGSAEAPPLRESTWLAGSADRLARIVLHGLEGPIDVGGQRWDRAMPKVALDDDALAAVLTYVRREFAQAAPVSAAFIRDVRAATAARDRPWTASELSGW